MVGAVQVGLTDTKLKAVLCVDARYISAEDVDRMVDDLLAHTDMHGCQKREDL